MGSKIFDFSRLPKQMHDIQVTNRISWIIIHSNEQTGTEAAFVHIHLNISSSVRSVAS